MKKNRSMKAAMTAAAIHERKLVELGYPQKDATASALSLMAELLRCLP